MKTVLILCSLALFTLNGVAADAVWSGADGAALNDAGNWTGGSPFYDATTNPSTPLCFNASAKATLTADMTAYQIKAGAGDTSLGFDLGSRTLRLMAALIDWNGTTGSTVTFTGGHLEARDANGALVQMPFASDSTVVFDGGSYTGDVAFANVNSTLVVTNGAKVFGAIRNSNYPKFAKVVIAGKGTVWDFNQYALRFGNRYATSGKTNNLYVTDYAVVTNFGSILTCDADASGKGIGPMNDGSVFEFSKGARAYALNDKSPFTMCAFGGDNSRFRVLSGSKLWLNGLGIGRSGNGHEVEVAGEGSLLYCRVGDAASVYFGYRGSRCRLWAHDHAVVTNAAATWVDGYFANETKDALLEVTDHAEFYSAGTLDVGRKQGYRCGIKLDNGGTVKTYSVNVGIADVARTNFVSVGSESLLKVWGILEFCAGADGRFSVSNGTVDVDIVGNRCGLTFGNGTEIVLAGRKPRVSCERSYSFGTNTLIFDIPKEGYDSSDGKAVLHCAHTGNYLNIPASVTPVFKMTDYIRHLGQTSGRVILLSAHLGPFNKLTTSFTADQLLAKWQKVLDDEYGAVATCKLSYNSNKSVMYLDVKRKFGLMLLVR